MTIGYRILPRAQEDAQYIFDYIKERSPQGAVDWWNAFENAVQNSLRDYVEYPLAPENEFVTYELRQVVFKTRAGRRYRFVFTMVDNEMRILRVRGPGQPGLTADEME